jgi:GNAT superfamily N-acetyltransferase
VPPITVRPFQRADREQLTELVNAHIGAVVPGWAVSVSAVMSQLEREPGEFVVDPWVAERAALVAVQRDAVVAGAYLKRFRSDDDVGRDFVNAGSIEWLVFWPHLGEPGAALMDACLAQLDAWGVATRYADGSLPSPATYGVPTSWPHVQALYQRAGFRPSGTVEIIVAAELDDLPAPHDPPLPGLAVRREVGFSSTRFVAALGDQDIAYMHVALDMTKGGVLSRLAGWAEVWELTVEEPYRRQGVATWLVGEVTRWLRLGRVDRIIDQAWPSETDRLGFFAATGFHELARTERGWSLPGAPPAPCAPAPART